MEVNNTYTVIPLLDVNPIQDIDDRAESRTYIVADRESGQAIIVDTVLENVERDLNVVKELGLTLAFAVETHIHADHITGASMIKDRTHATIVYGGGAEGVVTGADMFLYEGMELRFGKSTLVALATPGHTLTCTSYVLHGAVFTGDALFIRGNGRTDLQGGSAETLFHSVRTKLFALPNDTIIYPGHDYHGRISSTIGEEKAFNERLNVSVDMARFVEMMNKRNEPPPAKMDIAIPANTRAGRAVLERHGVAKSVGRSGARVR
jgi:glyoxylase-like metal-dependent hydrolase (beta-lactamase superfamily II)